MVSPQCENGFARIANEILEALARVRIPGRAYQILNAVFRKSYGFNQKTAVFNGGELSKMTGLKRQYVYKDLSKLIEMNIVDVTQKGYVSQKGYKLEVTFNKDYEKWKMYPKKVTTEMYPKKVTSCNPKRFRCDGSTIIVKEKKKDNIFLSETDEMKVSVYLFEHILQNNPKAKKPNFQVWAKHIEKAIKIDKRSVSDLMAVIEWSQKDPFWQTNILSTEKLRKQFDQLWMKMNQQNSSTGCRRTDANIAAVKGFIEDGRKRQG